MQMAIGLRRIARVTWWMGLALLTAGIVLFALGLSLPGGVLTGLGLAALGTNLILGGEAIAGPESRVFSAYGPVVNGQILVRAGWNNFVLTHGSADEIATMRYGPYGRPRFEERDGVAHLEFKGSVRTPGFTTWGADVATNILWDIDVRSGLGDLEFDLTNLRIETLTARTRMGRMTVMAPERGYARLTLRTGIGQITLRVPEDTGARIILRRGALASLEVKNHRLRLYGPDRYGTPDFDSAAARVEVIIETGAGDIVLA